LKSTQQLSIEKLLNAARSAESAKEMNQ